MYSPRNPAQGNVVPRHCPPDRDNCPQGASAHNLQGCITRSSIQCLCRHLAGEHGAATLSVAQQIGARAGIRLVAIWCWKRWRSFNAIVLDAAFEECTV